MVASESIIKLPERAKLAVVSKDKLPDEFMSKLSTAIAAACKFIA